MSHRDHFPIFSHHPDLVYLDSAATTQKPLSVIEAEMDFYTKNNANTNRGLYGLAASATSGLENTREKVRRFLNASSTSEIVFTSGATEGVNLVAQCFVAPNLREGENVVISAMEHHANLVVWQQICQSKKAELRVVSFNQNGVLNLDELAQFLDSKTKILALTHVSNTLGTINPIEEISAIARKKDVPILLDAAQSAATLPLDVQLLDLDFVVFSAHKLFGPTGVGVLFGKKKHLNTMPPYRFGGGMIRDVRFGKTLFAPPPYRFEAGTPNVAGIVGFGAALDFIEKIGQPAIKAHTDTLLLYATEKLTRFEGIEIIGNAPKKSGIISFILRGSHPHDVASILDAQNIALRVGHHCTQPIMDFFDLPGTCRVSFSIYNTKNDIDRLIKGLEEVKRVLKL